MTNKKKPIRKKGKIMFSRAFQELKKGDLVAVNIERAARFNFPERIQGRTGVIDSKKGREYIVKIKDINMVKKYIINPIHLKKIKEVN
jgi:ribosomal protein L21E